MQASGKRPGHTGGGPSAEPKRARGPRDDDDEFDDMDDAIEDEFEVCAREKSTAC